MATLKPVTPVASSAEPEQAAMRIAAAQVKRRIERAHAAAYRRAVRELVAGGCSEDQARRWLSEIGVAEPEQPPKKK